MSRINQDESETAISSPEDLVIAAFSRCIKYPTERAGVLGLAQGLAAASTATGVPMDQIVSKCAAESHFCPSDHDLLTVAREIRDARLRAAEESKIDREKALREQYGEPQAFDWKAIDLVKARRVRAENDELWSVAKVALNVTKGNWPSMGVIVEAARKLGFPKTITQGKTMQAWGRE